MTQSLYRKYRPQRFSELVGQEHITTALRNGVRDGRVGHAYLFTGPRGTGKTTTARILAKALNCLDLSDDGEPCAKCENCVAIAAGTFFDLDELDAASNNGVDNVRDLIQSVNLGLGATAKQKVYLIDEVHMLSGAAANALLKTLEEPPQHVVFILATTDPQKVLPTIRSRTQQFDFRLFTAEELTGLLADVLAREGVEADAEALNVVARRGAGSARDSLSILDQALALGGGALDGAQVQATFGGTPFDARAAIATAIGNDDPAGAIVAVQEVLAAGIEPRRLADDLLATVRDAFVQLAGKGRVAHDGPGEELPTLAAIGETLGAAGLTRTLELLGAAIVDIRSPSAPDPRLVLEVAIVRCARRDSRTAMETLLDRVERLEQRLESVGGAAASPPGGGARPIVREPVARDSLAERSGLGAHLRPRGATSPPVADAPVEAESEPAPAPEAPAPPPPAPLAPDVPAGVSYELDDVIVAWGNTVGALDPPLRAVVQEAQPIAVEGATIVFGVPKLRADAINRRFRAEAEAIKHGLATHLGSMPALKMRPHDFDRVDTFRPADGPAAAPSDPGESPTPLDEIPAEEMVDLHDLVDAPPDDRPVDSTARLLEAFGGEIVEERPRSQ